MLEAFETPSQQELSSAKAINDALVLVRSSLDRVPTRLLEDKTSVANMLDELLIETGRWALAAKLKSKDAGKLH